jgi:ketosteroid isomerase-like protein
MKTDPNRKSRLRWLAPSLLVVLVVLVGAGSLATVAHSGDTEKQAIRRVIESFSSALDSADLVTLLTQIADDATIDSKIARARVSKQKYADAMAAAFRTHEIVGFETRDIKITMVDSTHATVLATIYPMKLGQRFIYAHEWKLEKRDGLWLIVQTTYPTPVLEPVEPLRVV